MSHPFRFGVQAHEASSAKAWAEIARKTESLGYSSLTVPDHLDGELAPVPALMAAAAATDTLRVGALVLCNDFRHPGMLAREAASIDLLTEGRFELGMGAGWKTTDYQRLGITRDPAGTRIERLEEAVEIVTALLKSPEPLVYNGEHYRIDGLPGLPRPVQSPRPPLVIGGGAPKILSVAARHADIIGINVGLRAGVIGPDAGPQGTAAATREKIELIRSVAGDRFDSLELHCRVHVVIVTDDQQATAEMLAPALGITPAEGLASPHSLVGSVDEICDKVRAHRDDFGISYWGISDDAMDAFAPVVAKLAGT